MIDVDKILRELKKAEGRIEKMKSDMLVGVKQEAQRRAEVRLLRIRRRESREKYRISDKYEKICLLATIREEDKFEEEQNARIYGAFPEPADLINRRADIRLDIKACPLRTRCQENRINIAVGQSVMYLKKVKKCIYPEYMQNRGCDYEVEGR